MIVFLAKLLNLEWEKTWNFFYMQIRNKTAIKTVCCETNFKLSKGNLSENVLQYSL